MKPERPPTARPGSSLTSREIEALAARDAADTDAEAARALGVSLWTLRSHLRNARSKLRVRTTQRAIRDTHD